MHNLFLLCCGFPLDRNDPNKPDKITGKVVVVISNFVMALKLVDILLSFKGTYDHYAPNRVKAVCGKNTGVRLDTLMYVTSQGPFELLFNDRGSVNLFVFRYYGNLTSTQRETVLNQARSTKRPTVMFVSLKSGNTCVDMTFANNFVFLDRWWTPSTEYQMQERGMRFVPASEVDKEPFVNIHYYTMSNSVEDLQELIQSKKYEREMEFFGDAIDLEVARAKRELCEEKVKFLL